MRNPHFTATFVACAAAALAFAATAHAQSNRTFVSTAGSDTNNCGPTTPCRTFAAALALTNPGGELVVLTSGGYGAATITQPVTITAIGVDASITATSGYGVTISTTGNVTINGLGLHGQGTGQAGVYVQEVGYLRLYNVIAEKFTGPGVYFAVPSGSLSIDDSRFNDNDFGLLVIFGDVYVHNTGFEHNVYAGVVVNGGVVAVADSYAISSEVGFNAGGGSVSLTRDDIAFNGTGVLALSGATVQLSYCFIAQNTSFAYYVAGATILGTSPGTNTTIGATSGSLSAVTTLH